MFAQQQQQQQQGPLPPPPPPQGYEPSHMGGSHGYGPVQYHQPNAPHPNGGEMGPSFGDPSQGYAHHQQYHAPSPYAPPGGHHAPYGPASQHPHSRAPPGHYPPSHPGPVSAGDQDGNTVLPPIHPLHFRERQQSISSSNGDIDGGSEDAYNGGAYTGSAGPPLGLSGAGSGSAARGGARRPNSAGTSASVGGSANGSSVPVSMLRTGSVDTDHAPGATSPPTGRTRQSGRRSSGGGGSTSAGAAGQKVHTSSQQAEGSGHSRFPSGLVRTTAGLRLDGTLQSSGAGSVRSVNGTPGSGGQGSSQGGLEENERGIRFPRLEPHEIQVQHAQWTNPLNWAYLAEGGKNLLVRYVGPMPSIFGGSAEGLPGLALRLRKVARQTGMDVDPSANAVSQLVEDDSPAPAAQSAEGTEGSAQRSTLDEDVFREDIVAPLLGPAGGLDALPYTLPVPLRERPSSRGASMQETSEADGTSHFSHLPYGRGLWALHDPVAFLEALAQRIEADRPQERKELGGIDVRASCLWVVEDLTAPVRVDGAGAGNEVTLCVEIKPKWGFVAQGRHLSPESASAKSNLSRFSMHRILKASQRASAEGDAAAMPSIEQWQAMYNPLDLFSYDPVRVRTALKALFTEWHAVEGSEMFNNLRLFVDGRLVTADARLDELSGALRMDSNAASSEDAVAHAFAEAVAPHLLSSRILRRLSELQSSLDPLDIEGLAKLWQTQTRAEFGSISKHSDSYLLSEPTVDEYEDVVQWLFAKEEAEADGVGEGGGSGGEDGGGVPEPSLRQLTLAYLLSASFKDCSLFIRLVPVPGPRSGQGSTTELDGDGDLTITDASQTAERRQEKVARFEAELKLIDLDPKPVDKLTKYLRLDSDIVKAFTTWAKEVDLKISSLNER